MKTILGIELSVDTIRAARVNEAGRPELLLNNEGLVSTPAAIHFADDKIDVGSNAQHLAGLEENAFAEFLRDFGNNVLHRTPHGTFSPSDLCAILLKPVIENTKENFGGISAVTIAIPHNLSAEARLEVTRSATLAGIYKPNLINDNTSEALYLQYKHKLKGGKYLLVNLRAGTADATVFEIGNNFLSIPHVSGIRYLGLNDLKHSMLDIISEKFAQKLGRTVTKEELFMDCCVDIHRTEELIMKLGATNPAELNAWSTTQGRISIQVTRKEFEERMTSHTRQLEYLIEGVLDRAGVSPRALDGCFLSTSDIERSFWASCIDSFLGMQPLSSPDGSIAMGAALYGANKSKDEDLPIIGREELKSIKVQDVSPCFVGILEIDWLTRAKRNRIIIPRASPCHAGERSNS